MRANDRGRSPRFNRYLSLQTGESIGYLLAEFVRIHPTTRAYREPVAAHCTLCLLSTGQKLSTALTERWLLSIWHRAKLCRGPRLVVAAVTENLRLVEYLAGKYRSRNLFRTPATNGLLQAERCREKQLPMISRLHHSRAIQHRSAYLSMMVVVCVVTGCQTMMLTTPVNSVETELSQPLDESSEMIHVDSDVAFLIERTSVPLTVQTSVALPTEPAPTAGEAVPAQRAPSTTHDDFSSVTFEGSDRSDLAPDDLAPDPAWGVQLETAHDSPLFEQFADSPDEFILDRRPAIAERIWSDHVNYYSPESLALLGSGLLVGGAMANTSIDDGIQRHFQSSVRNANSDEWLESLHANKELGNGLYTLPVFASAWAMGELFPDSELLRISGQWGERSIRGFMVGAPPIIVLQQLSGGSRPTEKLHGSHWQPFQDNNGISGHAFMGALPFITAAKMTGDSRLKFVYYAGSTLTPLSRINDNAHYPSQVALGWWMAFLAASAVDATDNPESRWKFYPYPTGDGAGVLFEYRY